MSSFRIPSLNWLRIFEAAARHQSFARAATELNMSAPAVSQQIQALEGYLGKPLFTRRANGVQLSPAGRDFLPTVQTSLHAIETKAAAIFGGGRIERVSIRSSQLMAMSWLPRVLASFEADNPATRVVVQMGDGPHSTAPDLEIRYRDETAAPPGMQPLIRVTQVVLGRPQDVARITDLEALLSFRLFDVATNVTDWRRMLDLTFGASAGRNPMIDTVDTTPLALLMVSQGLGLGIGHMPVCAPLAQALGLAVCPLLPPVPGQGGYFLETAPNQRASGAVQKLIDALHEAAAASQ